MKLGFFTMPVHPKGRPYVETLREDREAFILCDRLGYSEAYCGEHLTDECENIPNSMMFLASLVGATSRINLGTAVANLPFSHPLVVATNAAMLDTLLEGRFILGAGAGVLRSDAEAMGLLEQDRGAMFVEAIDQVIALWTREPPYDVTGKYWNITTRTTLNPELGVGAVVRPFRKPHPPIVGTVTDPNSPGIVALGRRGWWPVTANYLHANWIANHLRTMPRAAPRAGTRPIAPTGASLARSSSTRTRRWRRATAGPIRTAPTASTCGSSRPSFGSAASSRRSRPMRPCRTTP